MRSGLPLRAEFDFDEPELADPDDGRGADDDPDEPDDFDDEDVRDLIGPHEFYPEEE
jgi:hypothetical protein